MQNQKMEMENIKIKQKLENALIESLKELGVFPNSGHGEIVIRVFEGKITIIKKVESIKII